MAAPGQVGRYHTHLATGLTHIPDYNILPGSVLHLVLKLRGGGYSQLEDACMGIAAGGQIQQKIYKDKKRANIYDNEARERVWIHTVSTDLWEVRIEF